MKMDEKEQLLINLQLFAEDDTGEKTEKATPRRREEARKKGQVFKSTDLNAAVIMLAGFAAFYVTFPYIIDTLRAFTVTYLLDRTVVDFSTEYIMTMLYESLYIMAVLAGAIMLACFVAALLITYLQVGFIFSAEPLTPKLERLNPVEGFKRIFSKRALVELAKSLVKIVITGYIVYTVLKKHFYIL